MPDKKYEIEAAVLQRFLKHLDNHKEVQNIELMNLADFCRNCLSKWYMAECNERGVEMDYEKAREFVYGEPYDDWKTKYQKKATPEQLAEFQLKNGK